MAGRCASRAQQLARRCLLVGLLSCVFGRRRMPSGRTAPMAHPLLATQEGPTGTWSMVDGFDRVYGTIELRRLNATDVRYRASFRGEVIGWSSTLRLACERVHNEFL